ncbi:uncharacterized protein LOC113343881 [Papaver somniferum]|uniref:uncharacterized protein LOC113343881 n=1 Tax=Papaver somniferum TaxID=3469 RepID=UPI000E6FDBAD|nr:uncharacterized protein LOC113343881 [Papaver somniferum]
MINFSKSAAFIAGNITQERKNYITTKLGVKQLCSSDKYLGLPILMGKSKATSFGNLSETFATRLRGWSSKTLNQTARTSLVKSVLNTIPSHYIGNFKLPKNIIKKLNSIQRTFWWGHKSNKGLYLLAWDSLNASKQEGGLAFRNLDQFNNALIAKLAWRLCIESDKLWVQVLKPKYAPHYLMLATPRRWNASLVRKVFDTHVDNLILNMYIPQHGEDTLIWEPNREGTFTVKSAYRALTSMISPTTQNSNKVPKLVWKKLWSMNAPHKIKLSIWKYLKGIVPTLVKISHYKPNIDTMCPHCKVDNETIEHLLITCPYSPSVWLDMNINVSNIQHHNTSVTDWITSWFSNVQNMDAEEQNTWIMSLMITASQIWRNRCNNKGIRGKYFNGGINAEQAECLAIKEALNWASNFHLHPIFLESDCQNVVLFINDVVPHVHWVNQGLVNEIKHQLSARPEITLVYVHRSGNHVAHTITNRARF